MAVLALLVIDLSAETAEEVTTNAVKRRIGGGGVERRRADLTGTITSTQWRSQIWVHNVMLCTRTRSRSLAPRLPPRGRMTRKGTSTRAEVTGGCRVNGFHTGWPGWRGGQKSRERFVGRIT